MTWTRLSLMLVAALLGAFGLALGLSAAVAAGGTWAAVSGEEAARLGVEGDLTPMGAEWNGNEDGSIPAWNPNGAPIPAAFVPGSDNYINPYPDEKPLFSIDASNYQKNLEKALWLGNGSVDNLYRQKKEPCRIGPTARSAVRWTKTIRRGQAITK